MLDLGGFNSYPLYMDFSRYHKVQRFESVKEGQILYIDFAPSNHITYHDMFGPRVLIEEIMAERPHSLLPCWLVRLGLDTNVPDTGHWGLHNYDFYWPLGEEQEFCPRCDKIGQMADYICVKCRYGYAPDWSNGL